MRNQRNSNKMRLPKQHGAKEGLNGTYKIKAGHLISSCWGLKPQTDASKKSIMSYSKQLTPRLATFPQRLAPSLWKASWPCYGLW